MCLRSGKGESHDKRVEEPINNKLPSLLPCITVDTNLYPNPNFTHSHSKTYAVLKSFQYSEVLQIVNTNFLISLSFGDEVGDWDFD